MAMTLCFFPLLMCLASVQTMQVKFRDCGSKGAKASKVNVTPCTSLPCGLIRGKNASIDIFFTPEKKVSKVTASLEGIISGVKVPFPIPHSDACNWPLSKLKCPLPSGKEQDYQLQLPVKKFYPKLKLLAETYLKDDKGNTLICVEIALEIKDGQNSG
eukprot:Seg1798.8 transcript_id=Seg1798.8/GoldUCD/mRNA.D3Y31 product="NPC intracellular cholesterol transporter 2" protein_id=Seg1798.8/GoldUCD/D3Y31